MDEIQTKVLKVFLLAIHSHLSSLYLQLCLVIYISSNSRNLLTQTSKKLYVHEVGFCIRTINIPKVAHLDTFRTSFKNMLKGNFVSHTVLKMCERDLVLEIYVKIYD